MLSYFNIIPKDIIIHYIAYHLNISDFIKLDACEELSDDDYKNIFKIKFPYAWKVLSGGKKVSNDYILIKDEEYTWFEYLKTFIKYEDASDMSIIDTKENFDIIYYHYILHLKGVLNISKINVIDKLKTIDSNLLLKTIKNRDREFHVCKHNKLSEFHLLLLSVHLFETFFSVSLFNNDYNMFELLIYDYDMKDVLFYPKLVDSDEENDLNSDHENSDSDEENNSDDDDLCKKLCKKLCNDFFNVPHIMNTNKGYTQELINGYETLINGNYFDSVLLPQNYFHMMAEILITISDNPSVIENFIDTYINKSRMYCKIIESLSIFFLAKSIVCGNIKLVKILMDYSFLNIKEQESAALHIAIQSGKYDIARLLLTDAKYDENDINDDDD
jgi:hypothetical protein